MSNDFYSDDVNAEAIAENSQDPADLKIKNEEPVTTADMEIGDMDSDQELQAGSEQSYDEENVPGSDNV